MVTKNVFRTCLIVVFAFTFLLYSNSSAQCPNYTGTFTLPLGKNATAAPSMARPAKGAWYADPLTNACCVRLSDHATETANHTFARPDYSRRQAFNMDNTLVLLGMDGAGWWHLYNATTLAYMLEFSSLTGPTDRIAGDAECQWSATSPDTLYFMDNAGGLAIYKMNVHYKPVTYAARFTAVKGIRGHAGATSILTVMPGAAHCWTKAEGSPSWDNRYWGFQVETAAWGMLGYMVYDMQTDSIIGIRTDTNMPDHCSMSPSGRWFVTSGSSVTAYPQDLSGSGYFILGNSEHSDMGLNTAGQDIYCYAHYGSYEPAISYGKLGARNLDTHEYYDLMDIYGEGNPTIHLSGRAFNKPGWMVYSTDGGGANWCNNKILAFELTATSPRIVNIACQFNDAGTYWAETHATVSRDFTHLVWASTWLQGSAEGNVDAGMCVLPVGAVPNAAGTGIVEQKNSQTVSHNKISVNSFSHEISYAVDKTSQVQIRLFNCVGQMVQQLENSTKSAGKYTISLSKRNIALTQGVYFCEAKIGQNVSNAKIMIVK